MGQSNERKGMFDHNVKCLVGKSCGNPEEEGRSVWGTEEDFTEETVKFKEHSVRQFRGWAERKLEGKN